MNWDQFQCSLYYLCLCGTILAPLTLKQEVVSSKTIFTILYHTICRISAEFY